MAFFYFPNIFFVFQKKILILYANKFTCYHLQLTIQQSMRALFLLIFSLALCLLKAQSVANTTGATLSNATHIVDFSVGEVAVATYNNGTKALTQGVLQPYFEVVGIEDALCKGYELSAYPNPTTGDLSIETNYTGFAELEVFNDLGQSVFQQHFDYQSVSLSHLAIGTYLVRISNTDNSIQKTIKIVKL